MFRSEKEAISDRMEQLYRRHGDSEGLADWPPEAIAEHNQLADAWYELLDRENRAGQLSSFI